ncbi:MAG: ABC transporter permease [Candidatus Omnitrophota bacterium]
MIKRRIGNLGAKILSCIEYLGGLLVLLFNNILQVFSRPFKLDRILFQSKVIGVESLPIVSLVAFFLGMILAFQTAYMLSKMGSEIYIANIVALSLVRELGPVLTSLVVAGRNGASITAEIGTMKVSEQIDALETLATNPIRYLVVPRFLALFFMVPLLVIYADLIGIAGGWLVCVQKLGVNSHFYIKMVTEAIEYKDIFTGLLKSFVFAIIIAIVSCYHGMKVEGGAEGVGRATTVSVVNSFILIIVADCIFTAIFYFLK